MGIFSRKNKKDVEKLEQILTSYFDVLSAYTPSFTTFEGGVYEMELTRSLVHCFANHCSKLKPTVLGTESGSSFERTLQFRPNPLMDTKKYLYRLATITEVKNNAYILPLFNQYNEVDGFYPAHPDKCQLVQSDGDMWMKYNFEIGISGAVKFSEVGRLNKFQNKSELFGDGNSPLQPTMQMLDAQRQAIMESVKNSSNIKLLAKLAHVLDNSDVEKIKENFADLNFKKNKTGLMMVDPKISEVKQLDIKQFTIDDKQMALIKENAFDYFGTSEAILQNKYTSEEWNAYYEGKIEPWAVEMSLVHTLMRYSPHEIAFGNQIIFSSNRMNYLSVSEKKDLIQVLFDRGMLMQNEGREILNLPGNVPNGNKFYIRKEYVETYNQTEENI